MTIELDIDFSAEKATVYVDNSVVMRAYIDGDGVMQYKGLGDSDLDEDKLKELVSLAFCLSDE